MTDTLDRTSSIDLDTDAALHASDVQALADRWTAEPRHRIVQNAVAQSTIDDVALNRQVVTSIDHTFSVQLDDWTVTNQKQTGRCWMFAGLNLLRWSARRKLGVRELEFSQNYTMFWDKVERANYFFESIIRTADRDVSDRLVAYLLDQPLRDAGQWNMFVSLVDKYGVVPKACMPETESSSNTTRMNTVLRMKLREGASQLRDMHARGVGLEDLRERKREYLHAIYRILNIHLGTPPGSVVWQWRDTQDVFHRTTEMTPREFAREFVDLPLHDYVCLVHDPRPRNPTGRTYTVEHLGNVAGGEPVVYLNVDVALIKALTRRSVEGGEPVWFGCDTGKQVQRDLGVWDRNLYDFESVYDMSFGLDKAHRLDYLDTRMTHAMLFTGVDVVDGRVRRWRVENSLGEGVGRKGFFTMNDTWFDEYVFEVVVRKSELPHELLAALDVEPVVLPAWDPMGALAGR
jgi:bleomycin hydrolase